MNKTYHASLLVILSGLVLSACGGGGGSSSAPVSAAAAPGYTISGTVTGLGSGQLLLADNGADVQTVSKSGGFSFDVPIPAKGGYVVTVSTQPAGQTCTVSNGTGTVASSNVTNVSVVCSTSVYAISGTVSGLKSGEQVTLYNNSANPTVVSTNGNFSFSTPVANGGSYAVSLGTDPTVQRCTVTNGSGSAVTGPVSNVAINCATAGITVVNAMTSAQGLSPTAGLVKASDGNYYGVTDQGGANSLGTIFQYNPSTGAVTVAHAFAQADGQEVDGTLTVGNDGKLYGVSTGGGTNGTGTIFTYDPIAATFAVVYQFGPSQVPPPGNLTLAGDGNFYGLTNNDGTMSKGTLFAYNPTTQTLTTLHNFDGTDGGQPEGSELVLGKDGNLYGTTTGGGTNGMGTIFKYSPSTSTFSSLHSFASQEGSRPLSALAEGANGNFYGTTTGGGANDLGTLFVFNTSTSTLTVLHQFSVSDGDGPVSQLLLANDGNFYGTTSGGGQDDVGTIFMYSPATGNFVVIASFSNSTGYYFNGALIQGSDGYIYGNTNSGSQNNGGSVFRF